MHQTVLAGQNGYKCTEVHDLGHATFINSAHLDIGGDLFNAVTGIVGGRLVDRGNRNRAVIINVNGGAGLLGDLANGGAALANDVTDLVRMDLHGEQARGVFAHFLARPGDNLIHLLRMWLRPAWACLSATSMISAVMPEILISICRAVMPWALPATLKSISPR